ncbi:enoyl-CoA hydratase [Angustibacter aerolatus]|uniref:Enoyl-CoA hydratase n=1 Tax=Angustibacter aerolatus TaxID=1162965 RepID=A0ABQ6JF23_9ACTN|nr:enoyl-CoA hydratase-related protein [Angustibacter aerolatus]GMA86019.1 enoyl-CoA hydratase [Angustibacter aerolatus]
MTDPALGAPVTTTHDGAVATVRLDRPSAMNALTLEVKEALLAALREVAADDAVRAVVLTGSGRAFCVGQDLREHVADLRAAQRDPAAAAGLGTTVREHYNPIATLLATMPKPVIASVNGVAAGAGASFAFGCDVRLLGEGAGFNLAFAGIGLSADSGASWWLPRLVGPARAKEPAAAAAHRAGGRGARAWGWRRRWCPTPRLADRTAQARRAGSPRARPRPTRRSGGWSRRRWGRTCRPPWPTRPRLMDRTGATADHLAAVEAFVAKQPPVFEGR